ncbi:MAG: copper-binding protein [Candidatus Competibacteraceae bacterium]|nr:copper-binding protein [Candidatus Competibacteraceae bacterium]
MKILFFLFAALTLGTASLALAADPSHGDTHGTMHGGMHTQTPEGIAAEGTIRDIDLRAGKLVIEHGPIAELKWPTMVMDFRLQDPAMAETVQVGDAVRFYLVPGERGAYLIRDIKIQ